MLWRDGTALRRSPAFPVKAVDTLGAGDVFHGAFALALAEGRDAPAAMRFGSAAAALKCSRLGGSTGAPTRAEVEAFMAARARRGRSETALGHEAGFPLLENFILDIL